MIAQLAFYLMLLVLVMIGALLCVIFWTSAHQPTPDISGEPNPFAMQSRSGARTSSRALSELRQSAFDLRP